MKTINFWISVPAIGLLLALNPGCGNTFPPVDADGNTYNTIVVGNQEWMAENLRTTKYSDGTDIPAVLSNSEWQTAASGAFCIYPYDKIESLVSEAEVIESYGALYNWHAVETGKLCPAGWHVPTDEDWDRLINHLIDNYGDIRSNTLVNALRSSRVDGTPLTGEADTTGQVQSNPAVGNIGTDDIGFSALAGGYRGPGGHWGGVDYYSIGHTGSWWSATEDSKTLAGSWQIQDGSGTFFRLGTIKSGGLSIRCLRDE